MASTPSAASSPMSDYTHLWDDDPPSHVSSATTVLTATTSRSSAVTSLSSATASRKAAWTSSRCRKLARLYVYSTLPLTTIVEVINIHSGYKDGDMAGEGFMSANEKINQLLNKESQWLRPKVRDDMARRLTAMQSTTTPVAPDKSHDDFDGSGQLKPLYSEKRMHQGSNHEAAHRIAPAIFDALKVYSIPLIRDVRHLLDNASVASEDGLSPSIGDLSGSPSSFSRPTQLQAPLQRPGYIVPSDLLTADQFRQEHGVCIEGMDAHDTQACLCSAPESFEHALKWFWTVSNGLSSRAKRIMELGPSSSDDILLQDPFGNTIMHFMASRSPPELLIRTILNFGYTSKVNTAGQTFLHCLGQQWFEGKANLLGALLRCLKTVDFDVSSKDVYGRTIFHVMDAKVNDAQTWKKLVEGFDEKSYGKMDAFGVVPCSTHPTSLRQRQFVLDSQISIDTWEYQAQLLKTVNGAYEDPLLQMNGKNGLHCIASAILSYDDDINDAQTPSRLKDASEDRLRQRRTIVLKLLELGVDHNAYDADGNTVLMCFAAHLPEDDDYKGPVMILEDIINAGADVNARNRQGETALHVACRLGKKLAMRTLVQHGANVHARDYKGRTPLGTLPALIRKCRDDVQAYSGFEGCFAWLSGQGRAKLQANVVDEWVSATPTTMVPMKLEGESKEASVLEVALASMKLVELSGLHSQDEGLPKPMVDLRFTSEPSENKSMTEEANDSSDSVNTSKHDNQPSVDEICDFVLGSAFGVGLSDILHPEQAWESMHRCLQELSVMKTSAVFHSDSPSDYRQAASGSSKGSSNSASGTPTLQQSLQTQVPGKGKRSRQESNDDQLAGEGQEDAASSMVRQRSKKPKIKGHFSCPYRKRNPLRFNVRDHQNCALVVHDTISSLKRHIGLFHKKRPTASHVCPRCQTRFETSESLNSHLQVPSAQICSPRSSQQGLSDSQNDPEDGITPEVERQLAERKSKTQIVTWDPLWRVLFPCDTIVPSEDFESVLELDEVRKTFSDDSERCKSLVLDSMGAGCRCNGSDPNHNNATGLWTLFKSLIGHNLQRSVIQLACPPASVLAPSMRHSFGQLGAANQTNNRARRGRIAGNALLTPSSDETGSSQNLASNCGILPLPNPSAHTEPSQGLENAQPDTNDIGPDLTQAASSLETRSMDFDPTCHAGFPYLDGGMLDPGFLDFSAACDSVLGLNNEVDATAVKEVQEMATSFPDATPYDGPSNSFG